MSLYEPRQRLIDYLKATLYGPSSAEDEVIHGTPLLRYMTGLLFPGGTEVEAAANVVSASAEDSATEPEQSDDGDINSGGIELASEPLPAAVGLSFVVANNSTIRCEVWGARYVRLEKGPEQANRGAAQWARTPLASLKAPEAVTVSSSTTNVPVLGNRAKLDIRWRPRTDGSAIVTISLVNTQGASAGAPDPATVLFQVGLRCTPEGGVLAYPEVGRARDPSTEDAEVDFLYRKVQPFARGHGAAAAWGPVKGARADWVAVDFVPAVDVPKATFSLGDTSVDARACALDFLIGAPRKEVIATLTTLVNGYGAWAKGKAKDATVSDNPEIAGRLAQRISAWADRMQQGLFLLQSDEVAWRSFRLANEAMAIQMVLGNARPRGIAYSRLERRSLPPLEFSRLEWRPFQIGFLLGSIQSLMDPGSQDRDVVDVIWFPTGGGKTEAYLLLSAFELIRRRLVSGADDKATAIISRYTLRFLTVQQFQRTAALIIALEMLRKRTDGLGDRPFTLGMWVGNNVTPGTYRKAHEKFREQFESKTPRNVFLLQACPACGTEIFPRRKAPRQGQWTEQDFGVVARPDRFHFRCANSTCDFAEWLPLNVVDEALFDEPPSMLVGTIDKFAMLPWDERSRVFFGGPDDKSVPPSLVLQDELHLISGPLGSLAAPYDAAIDTIISARGPLPKRIASTATIRNAREQVRGLYGRQVAVFPSPASSWDDAYFFSTEKDKPGRTYLGVMGQGYIKPVVAMAWTSAALLQSVREVPLDATATDAYWTVLAYHNSRRELGRTLTAARDEIQARIKAIASSEALARVIGEPLELSAQMVKSLGEAIEELERPHRDNSAAVDFVPCTSIISVGVDLDRLGVMLMNGQPKLTSEYIQATSRVGRGAVPGLVVSLFSATKPRDRSHYEDFRAYHDSIYRHVEPTSVTPYALPARERTLHAALVAVVRHATQYSANARARDIQFEDPALGALLNNLRRVMCASDPAEAAALQAMLEVRLKEWRDAAESGVSLLYERLWVGQAFAALLTEFGKPPAGALWPTMMSVRNVDAEVRIRIS